MKIACQYAIVRFLPYMETGEFANIGVLAFAPKTGYLDFKLAPEVFPRVARFFSELDKKVYRQAVRGFAQELAEVKTIAGTLWGNDMVDFGREITRPRESLIRFSEVRVRLTDDPAQTLADLYEYYVGRNFVTRDLRERAMVDSIKRQLRQDRLQQFYKQRTLEKDFRKVQFPLVWEGDTQYAIIKPLALDQEEPGKLVEHAEEWKNKIQWLLNRNCIRQNELLIPLERPTSMDSDIQEAYQVAERELKKLKVELVSFHNSDRIMEFARQPGMQLH